VRRFVVPLVLIVCALIVAAFGLRRRGAQREVPAADEGPAPEPVRAPATRPQLPSEAALLRARVAELTQEIDKVKAAQAKEAAQKRRACLTGATSECPFLDQTPEELKEMARCGIVHMDMPMFDNEAQSPDGLSPEQQRMEQARVAVGGRVRSEMQALYREAGLGERAPESIADLTEMLERFAHQPDQPDVLRQIARERAGAPPPPEEQLRSIAQRYWRLRAEAGDWYEGALAKHLGAARAHALRTGENGWAMRAIYSGQCEGDAGQ
jgi:hypothetical protein